MVEVAGRAPAPKPCPTGGPEQNTDDGPRVGFLKCWRIRKRVVFLAVVVPMLLINFRLLSQILEQVKVE